MEESKSNYIKLDDNLSENNNAHLEPLIEEEQLLTDLSITIYSDVIDNSHTIWRLKVMGGYLKRSWMIALIYHILNISFAAWTFTREDLNWCDQFKITLFAIQLGSAALYFVAFRAFRYGQDNYMNQNKKNDDQHDEYYIDIRKKLQKTYKPPHKLIYAIIIFFYALTFGSGIGSWIESKYADQIKQESGQRARAIFQLILYVFDFFKWAQTTMIVLIIYGFLNTFSDRMQAFKTQIKDKHTNSDNNRLSSKHGHRVKSTNVSTVSSTFQPRNNPKPLIKFEHLNHIEFMKQYYKLTDPFKHVLGIFHTFITIFGVFNVIVWLLFVWTVSIAYTDATQACTDQDLIWFFVHYTAEIALYFSLWFILLWKLNRNHSEIGEYRKDFISRVVPNVRRDEYGNDHTIQLFLTNHARIISFLDEQLENDSPFAIFGSITPTASTGLLLFTSVLIPMSLSIWELVDEVMDN